MDDQEGSPEDRAHGLVLRNSRQALSRPPSDSMTCRTDDGKNVHIDEVAGNMDEMPDEQALGLAISAGRAINKVSATVHRASYSIKEVIDKRQLITKVGVDVNEAEEDLEELNRFAAVEGQRRNVTEEGRRAVANRWDEDVLARLILLKGLPDSSTTWKAVRKASNIFYDYQQTACRVIDQIHIRLTKRKGKGVTGKPVFMAIDFNRAADAKKDLRDCVTIQEVQSMPDLKEMAKQMGLDFSLLPSRPSNLLEGGERVVASEQEEDLFLRRDLSRVPTPSTSRDPPAETTTAAAAIAEGEVLALGADLPDDSAKPQVSLRCPSRQLDGELQGATAVNQPKASAVSADILAERVQPGAFCKERQPGEGESGEGKSDEGKPGEGDIAHVENEQWVFPTRGPGMTIDQWERVLKGIMYVRLKTALETRKDDVVLVKIVAEYEAAGTADQANPLPQIQWNNQAVGKRKQQRRCEKGARTLISNLAQNPEDALELAKDVSLERIKSTPSLYPGHELLEQVRREKEKKNIVQSVEAGDGDIEADEEPGDNNGERNAEEDEFSDMDKERYRKRPGFSTETDLEEQIISMATKYHIRTLTKMKDNTKSAYEKKHILDAIVYINHHTFETDSEASTDEDWCLEARVRERIFIKKLMAVHSLSQLEQMSAAEGTRAFRLAVKIKRRVEDRAQGAKPTAPKKLEAWEVQVSRRKEVEGMSYEGLVQECNNHPDDTAAGEFRNRAERRTNGAKNGAETKNKNAGITNPVRKLLRENTLEELKDLYDAQDEDRPVDLVLKRAFDQKRKHARTDTKKYDPKLFPVFTKQVTALWWWRSFNIFELGKLHEKVPTNRWIKWAYEEARQERGEIIIADDDEEEEEEEEEDDNEVEAAVPALSFSDALRQIDGGKCEADLTHGLDLPSIPTGTPNRSFEECRLETETFDVLKKLHDDEPNNTRYTLAFEGRLKLCRDLVSQRQKEHLPRFDSLPVALWFYRCYGISGLKYLLALDASRSDIRQALEELEYEEKKAQQMGHKVQTLGMDLHGLGVHEKRVTSPVQDSETRRQPITLFSTFQTSVETSGTAKGESTSTVEFASQDEGSEFMEVELPDDPFGVYRGMDLLPLVRLWRKGGLDPEVTKVVEEKLEVLTKPGTARSDEQTLAYFLYISENLLIILYIADPDIPLLWTAGEERGLGERMEATLKEADKKRARRQATEALLHSPKPCRKRESEPPEAYHVTKRPRHEVFGVQSKALAITPAKLAMSSINEELELIEEEKEEKIAVMRLQQLEIELHKMQEGIAEVQTRVRALKRKKTQTPE